LRLKATGVNSAAHREGNLRLIFISLQSEKPQRQGTP
jgi:hypothetical protein